jgi:hypothetical protein
MNDTRLSQFRSRYLLYVVLFGGLTALLVAWHWNQPRHGNLGFSYRQSLPILALAGLLVNGLSFYLQDRYVRRLLQRPQNFRLGRFVLRFYLYNLVVALALSVLLFVPLLYLIFFYANYPVIFWLAPYHLLIGWLLGREMQRVYGDF